MKEKLITELRNIRDEILYGIRWLCFRPSPGMRLSIIIFLFVALAVVNIWFVTSSIYNIGKRDAEKEFMKMQHIERLELPHKSDSIKTIKRMNFKKVEN